MTRRAHYLRRVEFSDGERLLTAGDARRFVEDRLRREGFELGPLGFTYARLYRLSMAHPEELERFRMKWGRGRRGSGCLYLKSSLEKFAFNRHIKKIQRKRKTHEHPDLGKN